jgi:hypothetical protein
MYRHTVHVIFTTKWKILFEQNKQNKMHTMSHKSSETGGAMCLNTAGAAILVSAQCSLCPVLSAALNAAAL